MVGISDIIANLSFALTAFGLGYAVGSNKTQK